MRPNWRGRAWPRTTRIAGSKRQGIPIGGRLWARSATWRPIISGLDLNREKWRPEPRSERFSTVHWTLKCLLTRSSGSTWASILGNVHVAGGSGGPDHFQPDHKGPARIGLAWVDRLALMRRSTAALEGTIAASSSTTDPPASPVRTCLPDVGRSRSVAAITGRRGKGFRSASQPSDSRQ